jgi:hypothetical protein
MAIALVPATKTFLAGDVLETHCKILIGSSNLKRQVDGIGLPLEA